MNRIKEIGSVFEYIKDDDIVRNQIKVDQYTAYLRCGRECLYWIGQEGVKKGITTVFVPALCCSSMIQPYIQLGLNVCYYNITSHFQIDFENLSTIFANNSILIVLHYYGIRSYKNFSLIKFLSSYKNIITIQDCTQHYFTNSLYDECVDFHIASLRKWVAVADGALLHSTKKELPVFNYTNSEFVEKYYEVMLLKEEFFRTENQTLKNKYRTLYAECINQLRSEIVINSMSPLSIEIFSKMNIKDIKLCRQLNYNFLLSILRRNFPKLVSHCVEYESPFCLPIVVENRDIVQVEMARKGIYCQVLWPIIEESRVYEFNVWFSNHMLAIPCDQRYSMSDMNYIATTLSNVVDSIYKLSNGD